MDIFTTISIVTTVMSFLLFLGIVGWAWSRQRGPAFEQAANAPFALPEEGGIGQAGANSAECGS